MATVHIQQVLFSYLHARTSVYPRSIHVTKHYFTAKDWPGKKIPQSQILLQKEACCFTSQVTSETDPTREERGVTSDTVPICEERAWLASSAIYYWKPSVLQCFNGRWSLSGIYLQQVRQKINKLLVGVLQVAPQRWFLWDQIFQLTCLLIFNRKWNKKNKYSAEWKLCKEQTTKLLMPKIFIVTVNICCLLG